MYVHDILTVQQLQRASSVFMTARTSTQLRAITTRLRTYHGRQKTDLESRIADLDQIIADCTGYLARANDPQEARDHAYRTWKRGKRSGGVEILLQQATAKRGYLEEVVRLEERGDDLLIMPLDKLNPQQLFKRAARAVMLMGDPDQGRILGHHYWSEVVDPLHRALNKPANQHLYERWLDQRYGVHPSTHDSFYRWLETQDVAGMSVSMYQTGEQREQYRIYRVHRQLAHDAGAHDLADTSGNVTNFSGNGWAIFVLSTGGMLYAGDHRNPDEGAADARGFYHSCFLAGAKVDAAGELKIRNGVLHAVSPKSGHYKPGPDEIVRFLQWADAEGCLPDSAKVQWFPMREGRLFPLKQVATMFPVFWYSARAFLNVQGNVDQIQPLRCEAKSGGGIGNTGRFLYDPSKGDDVFDAVNYVGMGDQQAIQRLGWENWL